MSPDRSLRLFVAVELPATVRTELCQWARHAVPARAGVRRLDAEQLHLTLCFLGSRQAAEVDPVGAVLERCAAPLRKLTLGAPVWLPRRRPRALAVEVNDESGELEALHRSLVAALAAEIGWEPERRSLRAHVTVARLGPNVGAEEVGRELPPTPMAAFEPSALTLYRSRLEPTGARYQALVQVNLI